MQSKKNLSCLLVVSLTHRVKAVFPGPPSANFRLGVEENGRTQESEDLWVPGATASPATNSLLLINPWLEVLFEGGKDFSKGNLMDKEARFLFPPAVIHEGQGSLPP